MAAVAGTRTAATINSVTLEAGSHLGLASLRPNSLEERRVAICVLPSKNHTGKHIKRNLFLPGMVANTSPSTQEAELNRLL